MVYILVFIANRIESEGVKYLYVGLVNNYSLNTISLYCIFEYIKGIILMMKVQKVFKNYYQYQTNHQ